MAKRGADGCLSPRIRDVVDVWGAPKVPHEERPDPGTEDEPAFRLAGLAGREGDLTRITRRLAGGADRADRHEPGAVECLVADDERLPFGHLRARLSGLENNADDRPAERRPYARGHEPASPSR